MSHVYNENNSTMLSMVMTVAECLNDGFYSDKPTPVFHISTEDGSHEAVLYWLGYQEEKHLEKCYKCPYFDIPTSIFILIIASFIYKDNCRQDFISFPGKHC